MQRLFKQTVRQLIDEAERLNDIRRKIMARYSKEEVQQGVIDCLTIDQRKATLASFGEFFIENNVFYTEKQIMDFIRVSFRGCLVDIPVDKLVCFFVIPGQEIITSNSLTTAQKQLYIKFDIFQLLNEAIKSNQQITQMKTSFRTKYQIAELFKAIRRQQKDYADASSIAKYCDCDPAFSEVFLKLLGLRTINIEQLHAFFQEEQINKIQDIQIVQINPPAKYELLIQQRFLMEYFIRVIDEVTKIQTSKQDLINQFPDLSIDACFLMFASSLNKRIGIKSFEKKCQQLGISQNQKAHYLFVRRFGQDGRLSLQSFKRFFTPVHQSFNQILLRRELKPLSNKSMIKVIKFIQFALKMELDLEGKKFRQTDYGKLFLKVDKNQDTFLCHQDIIEFFKQYGKKYTGKHLAIIFNRFNQNKPSNKVSYQYFVEQLQPKII